MVKLYHDISLPAFFAKQGSVDEVVNMDGLRHYLKSFAGLAYRIPNPSVSAQFDQPGIIRG
ncbi:MAG: hypothetical protein V6Z89_00500 [Desulfobacter sp.]